MPFPVYETKDQIPAGAEDVYEENDGRWVPKLPAGEDVTPLKDALDKERKARGDAEKAAKAAAEAKTAAERERDAFKAQVGDVDGRVKALLDKVQEDIANAVKDKDAEIDTLNGKLRTVTLYDKAKAAFLKAGGRPEKSEAALKLTQERFDLVDDRPVVKDEKGEVSTTTLDDFWTKVYRTEMPEFFSGTQAKGGAGSGGAPQSASGGASGTLSADDIMKNPGMAFDAANASGAAA